MNEWAIEFENYAKRCVGSWEADGLRVSTVFLGVDHNWANFGVDLTGGRPLPPLIYETMIFATGSHLDLYMWRYRTREAAEEGHRRIVDAIKAGEDLDGLEIEP